MALSRLENFEERLERRDRIAEIPVRRLRDRANPLEFYSCDQFKHRFHLEKETAIYIASLIKDDVCCPVKRGCQLPPIIQLLVAVRFYATGSFQVIVGDVNSLTQGTVSKIVKRISIAIALMCSRFIQFPTEEIADTKRKFYEIANFPGVVGAIDCTHVKINSPGTDTAELFRNRKGFFSINVQAICDADLNFTNVVARWYGSAHDSRIFDNSLVGMDLANGLLTGILLGDAGYGCQPFLMTPLLHPVSAAEKRYNKSQIKTRNTIERAFGIVKRRFPCLNHLRLKLNTSLTSIVAVFILHNISRKRLDIFENDFYVPDSDNQDIVTTHGTVTGRAARNAIIASYFA